MNTKKEIFEREFKTNRLYFEMMADWHQTHGGCAFEPEVVAAIDQYMAAQVLDAGCGEGSPAAWVAARYPSSQVMGVDISDVGIQLASQRFQMSNLTFQVDDLTNLSFDDGTFGLIYSQSVLEHVVGYSSAIREFYRVLQPGGHAIIRLANGHRAGKRFLPALLDVVRPGSRPQEVESDFSLTAGDYQSHSHNFDYAEIPARHLLATFRQTGFTIRFFTTRRDSSLNSEQFASRPFVYRVAYRAYCSLHVWPFKYLGPTSIVVAHKPQV